MSGVGKSALVRELRRRGYVPQRELADALLRQIALLEPGIV